MKRTLGALVLLVVGAVVAWTATTGSNPLAGDRGGGFSVYVVKADTSITMRLFSGQAAPVARIKNDTTITAVQVRTGGHSPTGYLHVFGIRKDSTFFDTLVTLVASDTVVTGSEFRVFQGAYLDTGVTGTVVIRGTGQVQARMDTLQQGRIYTGLAVLAAGKNETPRIKQITLSHDATQDTTDFEVRIYPTYAAYASGARGDNYFVKGSARLDKSQRQRVFDEPFTMSAGSVMAVYSKVVSTSVYAVANGITASVSFMGERR